MYYTYVLAGIDKLNNKHFYIGSTSDLRKRFEEHQKNKVKTTKSLHKLKLVYYEGCLNKTDSRKRELQLKTGFGRNYIKKRIEFYTKENARD